MHISTVEHSVVVREDSGESEYGNSHEYCSKMLRFFGSLSDSDNIVHRQSLKHLVLLVITGPGPKIRATIHH